MKTLNKIKDWLKTNWLQIVNMIILFLAATSQSIYTTVLVSLWFMVLVGYYGYKLFINTGKK